MGYEETKLVDAISLTDYENKPMEAYYLGSKEVQTKFPEPQQVHTFQKQDGTIISIWGFTSLNRLLEHTPKGILTKVTYTGKTKEPNKYGNHSHTCTVFYDVDNKLDGFKEVEQENNDNDNLPF